MQDADNSVEKRRGPTLPNRTPPTAGNNGQQQPTPRLGSQGRRDPSLLTAPARQFRAETSQIAALGGGRAVPARHWEGPLMVIDRDAYYIVGPARHRAADRVVVAADPGSASVVYDWRESFGDTDWVCDGCNSPLDAEKPVPAFGTRAGCQPCSVEFFDYPAAWWDGRRTELCDCPGCQKSWVAAALRTSDRAALLAMFREGSGLLPGEYDRRLEAAAAAVASAAGASSGLGLDIPAGG